MEQPTLPATPGQFLGLKLRMLGNSFRRGPWQIVGLVVGILYSLGAAGLACAGLIVLRSADADVARSAVIIGGSAILLGFAVIPLLLGLADSLDPRSFSLFGMENRALALGLLVAAAVSVPGVALALVSLFSVATWTRDPGSILLALISVPLILVTGVLAARVATSVAAFVLTTRRAREWLALLVILVLVTMSPFLFMLTEVDWNADGAETLAGIADVVAWTPFGAAWASPADAATGRWGLAIAHLLIALATAGVLWLVWQALLGHMLVTPQRDAKARSYGGLGWFDRLPDNPGGVIAARSLTYWLRDPRYRVSLAMIPITPLLLLLPFYFVGVPVPVLALIPVPVFAMLLGWSLHNDVAYDNTAIWLHVASGRHGRADRLGRMFPALLFGVPMIVIGSVVSAGFYGDWAATAALIGVGLSLLLAGMGFSSIMSARFPYAVVRPGDSAFSQPQNTGVTMAVVQSVTFGLAIIASLAPIAFTIAGYFLGDAWFWWALLSGLGCGLVFLWIGIALGSRIFNRRGPELLRSALRNA